MEKRDQVDGSRSHEAALESERLSRVVGEKVLVNEISVQVHVGEVLAVVGPSGSGKTSFLRLLNLAGRTDRRHRPVRWPRLP